MTGYKTSSKHKILSREEEVILGRTVQAGLSAAAQLAAEENIPYVRKRECVALIKAGETAKETFILHNLRLAMDTAARFSKGRGDRLGIEYSDLIQEAVTGLMHAVDKFDPEKGWKFSTYATWWCRQACQRAIANSARAIRLPMHVESDVRKLAAVLDDMSVLEHSVSKEYIADFLGWSLDKLAEIWTYYDITKLEYLDTPISDETSTSHIDTLVDIHQIPVDEEGIQSSLARDLEKAFAVLADEELKVLTFRYGLDRNRPPLSLQQIGAELGITRERVRQIEAKAIAKLRHPSSGVAWAFMSEDMGLRFLE